MSLNCTLKMVKWQILYHTYFSTIKKCIVWSTKNYIIIFLFCLFKLSHNIIDFFFFCSMTTTVYFHKSFTTPSKISEIVKQQFLFIPSSKPLAISNILSVSINLSILDILYKWDHTIFVLWTCLISLSMFLRFIHVVNILELHSFYG